MPEAVTSQARVLEPPSAASQSRVAEREPRLVYVDWLRVLAVIGVFVIHVCEPFNPWDEWHISSPARSAVAGEIVVLMAPWIMPLFMLLAGVSAWYSLQRRSNAQYVKERITRVLLPLLAGILLFVPPQVYLERRWRGQFTGSFLEFFPHFFHGIYPRGNLSWHHLWFLGHLFAYSLVALPLFRAWIGRGGSEPGRIARICAGPAGLLWLALPLVLERQLLWGIAPERHMLASDWANHAILFVAYVYGFVLAGTPWLGAAIDAQWRRLMLVAVASTVVLVAGTLAGEIPTHIPPPYSPTYLVFWTLYAVGAWAWMIGMLGVGRRWLRRDTRFLAYGREIGYGWYLVHQPVIIGVTYVALRLRSGVWAKILVVFLVSAAGTLVGAEIVRRLPLAGRLLGVARPGTGRE